MKIRFAGVAGLALGLALLGGGIASASAQGQTAVPLAYSSASPRAIGAGLSAPLFKLLATTPAAQDSTCAAQDQSQTDAAESATAGAADTDTVDLQCGDQTGTDGAADNGAETSGASESNTAAGNDFAVDGIDQQGQNAG